MEGENSLVNSLAKNQMQMCVCMARMCMYLLARMCMCVHACVGRMGVCMARMCVCMSRMRVYV